MRCEMPDGFYVFFLVSDSVSEFLHLQLHLIIISARNIPSIPKTSRRHEEAKNIRRKPYQIAARPIRSLRGMRSIRDVDRMKATMNREKNRK